MSTSTFLTLIVNLFNLSVELTHHRIVQFFGNIVNVVPLSTTTPSSPMRFTLSEHIRREDSPLPMDIPASPMR
ncbi:unnamed protein product [Sphenostylis stenocarpa]|uniref:Secreted protein n=1 Tax=Sphenostylis stenocarpa TaxID=92480 RepID=A0AA86S9U4_9FABA|nr:unnamed protein product [Sphenostylis stenocarpa]